MSIRQNVLCSTRFAVLVAGIALAAAPAFAGYNNNPPPPSSCYSNCGGSSVPEPSTLTLLGVTIPGAAAWISASLLEGPFFHARVLAARDWARRQDASTRSTTWLDSPR